MVVVAEVGRYGPRAPAVWGKEKLSRYGLRAYLAGGRTTVTGPKSVRGTAVTSSRSPLRYGSRISTVTSTGLIF